MSEVIVRVLGPLQVLLGGVPVDLGGVQQRRLLAVLVANGGRVVRAAELVEVAWPDGGSVNAEAALRTYVSRLRRSVGSELIRTETPGYRLDLSTATVDADRFGELAMAAHSCFEHAELAGAIESADAALALWRGEPYLEFAGESWAQPEAARLMSLGIGVREVRLAALVDVGRHNLAIAELEALCSSNPERERAACVLALARYRAGRQSEALQGLAEHRRRLVEGFGLEPSDALRHLEDRILAQDPSLLLGERVGTPLLSYVLEDQLGEGAFAQVFRATQPSVGRAVAVKVIRAEFANRPEFIRRFETEAHLVARLEHPYIVPLYDYWREPDRACLVMRLLRGGTLEQLLSEAGPLPLATALTMVVQVGGALTVAHRAGVVHRDVKPANVFLDGDGNFYLGDFGIALDAAEGATAEASLSAGSPAYASPEQLRREPVGPTADVHGLGITLYEALTGSLPFPEESTQAGLLHRQLTDPVPSVAASVAGVPAAVDQLIQRATAKDPARRYQSVAELVTALQDVVGATDRTVAVGQRTTATVINLNTPNPYKGLRAFTEADAGDFCGRDRLVDRLLQSMRRAGTVGRVLAVVGPSGIGKSSVVRAGLLPALRRGAIDGSERWFIASMVPGHDPFDELATALQRVATDPTVDLRAALVAEPRALARLVKAITPAEGELLLMIDQFEELFTMVADESLRRRFLAALVHAVTDQRCPLRLVLTLRADFYDRPLRYGDFARLLRDSTVPVLPLAADELERAMVDPAGRAGVVFEPGLVSRMVADVSDQPSALPILQYALTELYERRVSGMVTVAGYDALGGVAGALAMRAEELFAERSADEQAATRSVFGRLVTLGEGSEDTRRRVTVAELGSTAAIDAVLKSFGDGRLLSFDHDPLSREPTVELAHEALLRSWPRLQDWVTDDRDALRLHRHLTTAARAWDTAGRDPGELYRSGRLDAALEWTEEHGSALNDVEAQFLEASVALRDREHERRRRTHRRLQGSLLAVAVALALATVAAAVAVIRQREASQSAARARSEAVRAQAATLASDRERLVAQSKVAAAAANQPLALLLALEAVRIEDDAQTRSAVLNAELAEPRFLGAFPAAGGPVRVDVRDGAVIGLQSDGTVSHWDPATRRSIAAAWQRPNHMPGDGRTFPAPRLSANRLAVPDIDSVQVFDLASGDPVSPDLPLGPAAGNNFAGVALSADGTVLYLAGFTDTAGPPTGVVQAVDVATGAPLAEWSGHNARIQTIAASPDGRLLATGSSDGSVIVWDAASHAVVAGPLVARLPVYDVAFNMDGSRLAVTTGGTVQTSIWSTLTGERISGPFGSHNSFGWAAFDPTGELVATVGLEGTAAVWSAATGTLQTTIRLPNGGTSVAFASPDRLVTGTPSGAYLWSLDDATSLGIAVGDGAPRYGSFSPDGTLVALAAPDQSVLIAETDSGAIVGRLDAAAASVGGLPAIAPALAWRPDGAMLAVAGAGGMVRFYDRTLGTVTHVADEPQLLVGFSARFSSDGKLLVVGGAARLALFEIDAQTPRYVKTLVPGQLSPVMVRFGEDDRTIIASPFLRPVQTFDTATGQSRRELAVGDIVSLDITADGGTFVVGQPDGSLQRRVAADGMAVGAPVPTGMSLAVSEIHLAARANVALAVGTGTARVVDLNTDDAYEPGFPVARTEGFAGVSDVSPDGERAVLTSRHGAVIWSLSPEDWISQACALTGRNLTAAEWATYFPNAGRPRATCAQWPLPAG